MCEKTLPIIKLETAIHAPVTRVFDLARSIDAHLASAAGSGERAVAGRTSGMIQLGETVTWQARHFGIQQQLTVKITAFDRPRMFQDEMIEGAFESMCHCHRFESSGDGTLMKDEFRFIAPMGVLGRIAERLFLTQYMERFLITRNGILKEMAESEYAIPELSSWGYGGIALRALKA